MSNQSESSRTATRTTTTRRYWRRTASPRPWWPWGILPVVGLVVLFLFGALVTAPDIQAEVQSEVTKRLQHTGHSASVVRSDGQGVDIQAVAQEREAVYLHALARSTQCETWAGELTCPTAVSLRISEPQSRAIVPAPDPVPAVTVPMQTIDEGPDCNAQFDTILSGTTIRFRTGSAAIDRGNEKLLRRLAETAHACPGSLTIAGYTDSRGAADANRALSLARAQAVGDALVQLGIDSRRITARGLGEAQPVADNDTPEGRARNRRIAITVTASN